MGIGCWDPGCIGAVGAGRFWLFATAPEIIYSSVNCGYRAWYLGGGMGFMPEVPFLIHNFSNSYLFE